MSMLVFMFLIRVAAGGIPACAGAAVDVTISVDWEGDTLNAEDLDAMARFRDDYPELRLVQFLNAAYFTQEGADAEEVRGKIASVLRPGDELGLHIHGWEGLFRAAGVKFRDHPTFWSDEKSRPNAGGLGHDVPISLYSVEELRKVIRFSVAKLGENGFSGLKAFRAGGWLATPGVREALVAEGFSADSSAVPAEYLSDRIGSSNLYRWVKELWAGTSLFSQPYDLAAGGGTLREFPDNLCLADYVQGEQVVAAFRQLAARGAESGALRLHFGFHQETAARYLGRVRAALEGMRAYARQEGIALRFVTLRGGDRPGHSGGANAPAGLSRRLRLSRGRTGSPDRPGAMAK